MTGCSDVRMQMAFYLDEELHGGERAAIELHLKHCTSCRELFEAEKQFLESIDDSRPLYVGPSELRARVNEIVNQAPSAYQALSGGRRRLEHVAGQLRSSLFRRVPIAAITAMLVVLILFGIWKFAAQSDNVQHSPSEFASTAVAVHQRHLQGRLPLEIVTADPEQISAWFAGKVPFRLELPNYQESSGSEKRYVIQGARLVGYKNDYAAQVVYRMDQRRISLLVTSRTVAQPNNGEKIFANDIAFHHDSIGGFKVITWCHRELTYALVSDFDSPA